MATANLLTNSLGGHSATLLPNGKVLVAGGAQYGLFTLTSAELYDPATGTWTATGSLTGGRTGHTATLLPNGKVLVAGGFAVDIGYGGYSISSVDLYDPDTGTWTSAGQLSAPRHSHTATLLTNGKVLVTGGYNTNFGYGPGPIDSADLYDPDTGTSTPTGSLTTVRYGHSATLLDSGKVLVAGGAGHVIGTGLVYPTSAELYDPESETWTLTGEPRGAPRRPYGYIADWRQGSYRRGSKLQWCTDERRTL